jgi:hypothetical protein
MDKLKLFWTEAKGKVTTYVGLLIASSAEIRDNWSGVSDFVKGHPRAEWAANHVFVLLGLLVIWARVRRALKS